METGLRYKGYHIDIADDDTKSYIIYDSSIGDYLEHETFYDISEVELYIDNLE